MSQLFGKTIIGLNGFAVEAARNFRLPQYVKHAPCQQDLPSELTFCGGRVGWIVLKAVRLAVCIISLQQVVFSQDVGQRFLSEYCMDCHGAKIQEGGFRVDSLLRAPKTGHNNVSENGESWVRVIDRLESTEMPPAGNPQPSPSTRRRFLKWAKTLFAEEANWIGRDGRSRIRRLNRLEYENTVHDLLGIGTPLQLRLPKDASRHGFNNASNALSISSVHLQEYMAIADVVLNSAIARQHESPFSRHRFSYCDPAEERFFGHACNEAMIRCKEQELWFYAEPHAEAPAILQQLSNLTRLKPGFYDIEIRASSHGAFSDVPAFGVWTASDNRRRALIGYFDAPSGEAASIRFKCWFEPGESIIIGPYRLNQARVDAGMSLETSNPSSAQSRELTGPALVVEPVEVEGPLHSSWPNIGHKRLFGDLRLMPIAEIPEGVRRPDLSKLNSPDALTPVSSTPAEDAQRLLARFLRLTYRRPVTDADVLPFVAIVEQRLRKKECFELAMMAAYRAVLCSPEFLFLVELPGVLSDHALACRLSYLLWRTAPDSELRRLADRGELRGSVVLRRETERLLNSPRANAFVNDFLDQWLNLSEIDSTTPDRELYPEYFESTFDGRIDGLLHNSVVKETRAYFSELLRNDGSLMQLVNSDHSFLNARLARHYGIPNVYGTNLRRVKLPVDSVRGGILTHASVLKVTANGATTSPVRRGVWIMQNVLGIPVPSPPPGTDSIEPDIRGTTTIREQLKKHQSNESCAYCHRRIDPPGFALEAFDPIGRFRSSYRVIDSSSSLATNRWDGTRYASVHYRPGADVDFSGKTAAGSSFASVQEFKKILEHDPNRVARCLAAKLVTFATGQKPELGDLLALDAIVASTQTGNYGLRTLIHEIVQSALFRKK